MGYALLVLLALFSALLIPFSASASAGAAEGLRLFALQVLPALFPFLVCAHYITSSGLLRARGSGALRFAAADIVCAFCGTPSAALICSKLCEGGAASHRKASVLCAAMNQMGPVFVCTAVAGGFLGSSRFALPLCVCHYLPGLIASSALGIKSGKLPAAACAEPLTPSGAVKQFCRALEGAVSASLRIGGTIVFFCVIHSVFSEITAPLSLTPTVRGVLAGLLEMTNGLRLVSSSSLYASALCAFLLSFGGMSIFVQSKLIFEELEPLPYFLSKFAYGAVSALLMLGFLKLFPQAEASFSFTGERAAELVTGSSERLASLVSICTVSLASVVFSLLFSKAAAKK